MDSIRNFISKIKTYLEKRRESINFHKEIVKIIPDEEDRNNFYVESFISWIRQGKINLVQKSLISSKWRIANCVYSKFEMSPLIVSCIDNKLDMVKLLLEHWADVNYQDINWWTALTHACIIWNIEVVKVLFDNRANPHIKDKMGWTAINWALTKWHKDIIELFEKILKVKYVIEE